MYFDSQMFYSPVGTMLVLQAGHGSAHPVLPRGPGLYQVGCKPSTGSTKKRSGGGGGGGGGGWDGSGFDGVEGCDEGAGWVNPTPNPNPRQA